MSTLRNPEEWLLEALGGRKSSAGVRVNYRTALGIAYVYAAQQIISGDVARLPLEPKRVEDDEDEVRDRMHPAFFLLNGDANDSISAYVFRETLTHWALLFGNGLAYILRNSRGRPTQLIPALPGDLVPMRKDGRTVYHCHEMDETFDQESIFHLRGLGDEMWGHPLLQLAKDSFGLSIAQDKHGGEIWKNGGQPKIILKHPRPLDKETADTLLESFEKRHREAGRPALASGGLEIESFPVKNTDAQWIESRKQIIVEIAAWYNMPPHKLGDNTRVGYNGVAAENQAYLSQTLQRWLKRWETEAARKLLSPREYRERKYVIAHDTRSITDADTGSRTDEVVKLKEAEIITENEARIRCGYPRVEDGDRRQNSNKATPSTSTPDDTPEDDDTEAMNVARQPFVSLVAGNLERIAANMESAGQRKLGKGETLGDEWHATWTTRVEEFVLPCVEAASEVFVTMPASGVTATVGQWSRSVASGQPIYPSPQDLAEQTIGELR